MSQASCRDYDGADGPVEIRNGKKRRSYDDDDDLYEDDGGVCGKTPLDCLKKNILLLLLLVGVIAGVVAGVLIRKHHPDWSEKDLHGKRVRMYLQFLGELFLRMLKCMIIPLIVSSLISGMAGLPGKSRGKIGGFAVLYYMITTFIAVIIGVILVSTIKPGQYAQEKENPHNRVQEPADFILDLIR
jgi:Na+/H+-dicarboxylate symporter